MNRATQGTAAILMALVCLTSASVSGQTQEQTVVLPGGAIMDFVWIAPGRGGPQNSDSVLSWTPTSNGRTRSHGYATELFC